jgi:esterase/lipase
MYINSVLFSTINLSLVLASANLVPSIRPKVCSQTAVVKNNGTYEKSLCYIKRKSSYKKAKFLCAKYGMNLYSDTSSAAASTTLISFVKSAFGNSRFAVAFVEGGKDNKCRTVNGIGKSGYDWCPATYSFFCEFDG